MSCNVTLCLANRSPRRLRTAAHGSKHIFRALLSDKASKRAHRTRSTAVLTHRCTIARSSLDAEWTWHPETMPKVWDGDVACGTIDLLHSRSTYYQQKPKNYLSNRIAFGFQPPSATKLWRLNPVLSRPSFATIVVDVTIRTDRQ